MITAIAVPADSGRFRACLSSPPPPALPVSAPRPPQTPPLPLSPSERDRTASLIKLCVPSTSEALRLAISPSSQRGSLVIRAFCGPRALLESQHYSRSWEPGKRFGNFLDFRSPRRVARSRSATIVYLYPRANEQCFFGAEQSRGGSPSERNAPTTRKDPADWTRKMSAPVGPGQFGLEGSQVRPEQKKKFSSATGMNLRESDCERGSELVLLEEEGDPLPRRRTGPGHTSSNRENATTSRQSSSPSRILPLPELTKVPSRLPSLPDGSTPTHRCW